MLVLSYCLKGGPPRDTIAHPRSEQLDFFSSPSFLWEPRSLPQEVKHDS